MNKAIRTDMPLNTLFVPFTYLLMTPTNIMKAKKIKNETTKRIKSEEEKSKNEIIKLY